MAICDWPLAERPREKLLQQGASSLSDAELLAIFLRTGTSGQSAVDLARELLHQFSDLRGLLNASQQDFCQGKGLGVAKYTQLQAVLEMAKRHFQQNLSRNNPITSPKLTRDFLHAQLRDESQEVFACLFLDSQHRVIVFERLFYGTIDSSTVYPREVLKRCLKHHAAAVILAHNHPSGIVTPSQADRRITEQLRQALALVDIRILDHFIIGDESPFSFTEHGWL